MTMTAKAKLTLRPRAATGKKHAAESSAPLSTEERLQRIEAMRQRIETYIQFLAQSSPGTSAEVKERAVAVFHDQMVIVESQLKHIHDEFRLE